VPERDARGRDAVNVLLLNGPNLNLLGEREPEIYGRTTLLELEKLVIDAARERGAEVHAFQSNHEGALIDRLHEARGWAQGCIFNPGAFTHYAWALHDAVSAVKYPVVEVHLSDLSKREAWRQQSVLAPVAAHRIMGRGIQGYLDALEWLLARSG
jgi:3-dehydroquinate dehydratase type II